MSDTKTLSQRLQKLVFQIRKAEADYGFARGCRNKFLEQCAEQRIERLNEQLLDIYEEIEEDQYYTEMESNG